MAIDAFEGCANLKEVFLPLTTEAMGDQVFMNCASLERVVLPYTSLPYTSFGWTMGVWLFRNCTSLKDVYILSSSLSFKGKSPFHGCKNFTVHAPSGSQIEGEVNKKQFVPLTEADAKMLAKSYFAEPILRHIYFNRGNMASRKTIQIGETVTVLVNHERPEFLSVQRSNGIRYDLKENSLFGDYLKATIISEVYKDEKDRNCFDVELVLKDGL